MGKKAKDWSKVDFEKVESQWEEGDEEAELTTEDEVRRPPPLSKRAPLFFKQSPP
jgi:hypothetical protein